MTFEENTKSSKYNLEGVIVHDTVENKVTKLDGKYKAYVLRKVHKNKSPQKDLNSSKSDNEETVAPKDTHRWFRFEDGKKKKVK